MPRYYFNVLNSSRAEDHEGVELLDLESARREAYKDVEDIKRQKFETLDTSSWTTWSIEICDEQGNVLLVIPFLAN
ncbi:DUF6894 family protein [Rhodoplanes sp. Z2-YC6860]|uniref:DUF6894 family protein n=1 Tax=Rhodoplanes sp. Z2-YC6860 TaxID=674703 RepID=UPI00078DFAF4|nr:hypothetical protein [Rhodoplanes sp. Z2-YC6860]AMN40438.1 hypothetical protein RHPLAN_19930 [Rhodoplanes sp. Z2-YC6860]